MWQSHHRPFQNAKCLHISGWVCGTLRFGSPTPPVVSIPQRNLNSQVEAAYERREDEKPSDAGSRGRGSRWERRVQSRVIESTAKGPSSFRYVPVGASRKARGKTKTRRERNGGGLRAQAAARGERQIGGTAVATVK